MAKSHILLSSLWAVCIALPMLLAGMALMILIYLWLTYSNIHQEKDDCEKNLGVNEMPESNVEVSISGNVECSVCGEQFRMEKHVCSCLFASTIFIWSVPVHGFPNTRFALSTDRLPSLSKMMFFIVPPLTFPPPRALSL